MFNVRYSELRTSSLSQWKYTRNINHVHHVFLDTLALIPCKPHHDDAIEAEEECISTGPVAVFCNDDGGYVILLFGRPNCGKSVFCDCVFLSNVEMHYQEQ